MTKNNPTLNDSIDKIKLKSSPYLEANDVASVQRHDIESRSIDIQARNRITRDEGKRNVIHHCAIVGFSILFMLSISIVFLAFIHLLCPSYSPKTNWDAIDKLALMILTGTATLKDKLLKLFDN